jgi:hypothetical protein
MLTALEKAITDALEQAVHGLLAQFIHEWKGGARPWRPRRRRAR